MQRRGGYLLLENIISISVILILSSILYYLMFFTYNTKIKLEDKVELQQQANEVSKYIEDVIGNSKGIMNKGLDDNLVSVTSIKCKYKENDNKIKDKEISLKTNTNKVFINTLNNNGNSEQGGYEIGDYIDSMYIGIKEKGKFAKVKLELSKNNQKYETEFSINIRNFEGDNI